jgi:hypothetical protein
VTLTYSAALRIVASILGPYAVAHEGEPTGFAVPRLGGVDLFNADEKAQAIDAAARWQAAGFYVDLYDNGVGAHHHPFRDTLDEEVAA